MTKKFLITKFDCTNLRNSIIELSLECIIAGTRWWFFQNLGKEAVPTFMHMTVADEISGTVKLGDKELFGHPKIVP